MQCLNRNRRVKGWAPIICFALFWVVSSFVLKITPIGNSLAQEGANVKDIPTNLKWSERMALSTVKRNAWLQDAKINPGWGYTQGLLVYAMEQTWKKTKKEQYLAYVKQYGNQ